MAQYQKTPPAISRIPTSLFRNLIMLFISSRQASATLGNKQAEPSAKPFDENY